MIVYAFLFRIPVLQENVDSGYILKLWIRDYTAIFPPIETNLFTFLFMYKRIGEWNRLHQGAPQILSHD